MDSPASDFWQMYPTQASWARGLPQNEGKWKLDFGAEGIESSLKMKIWA